MLWLIIWKDRASIFLTHFQLGDLPAVLYCYKLLHWKRKYKLGPLLRITWINMNKSDSGVNTNCFVSYSFQYLNKRKSSQTTADGTGQLTASSSAMAQLQQDVLRHRSKCSPYCSSCFKNGWNPVVHHQNSFWHLNQRSTLPFKVTNNFII